MPTPYETLGVTQTASADEIKKAYRKLAKQHHPDNGGDEEKFVELSRAVKVLTDPDKREKYDKTGDFEGAAAPDTEEGEACNFVAQILFGAIQSVDVLTQNPLEFARQDVENKLANLQGEIGKLDAAVKKMQTAKKRLTRKTKKKGEKINVRPNLLEEMFDGQIGGMLRQRDAMERAGRIHEMAIGILGSYLYQVDLRNPNQGWSNGPPFIPFAEILRGGG